MSKPKPKDETIITYNDGEVTGRVYWLRGINVFDVKYSHIYAEVETKAFGDDEAFLWLNKQFYNVDQAKLWCDTVTKSMAKAVGIFRNIF